MTIWSMLITSTHTTPTLIITNNFFMKSSFLSSTFTTSIQTKEAFIMSTVKSSTRGKENVHNMMVRTPTSGAPTLISSIVINEVSITSTSGAPTRTTLSAVVPMAAATMFAPLITLGSERSALRAIAPRFRGVPRDALLKIKDFSNLETQLHLPDWEIRRFGECIHFPRKSIREII